MKSTDVYRILRTHLAPVFKADGFKRSQAMLSWVRPVSGHYLVVWCQVSQFGWDQYEGSQFVVEFQLSDTQVVGARHIGRARLGNMVDEPGREQIRAIQNGVIASLLAPPSDQCVLNVPGGIGTGILNKLQKVERPYTEQDDIWLRYRTEQHVATWAQFIIRVLPACLEKAKGWSLNTV